jgi:hypothetical protein
MDQGVFDEGEYLVERYSVAAIDFLIEKNTAD